MPKMPLRVPPPQASTPAEQWIIDGIMHLDDCLDEFKNQSVQARATLRTDLLEIKAEVTAFVAASTSKDRDLMSRMDEHQAFHETMNHLAKERQSVWRTQWTWLKEGAAVGTDIIKVAGAIGLLKLAGVV